MDRHSITVIYRDNFQKQLFSLTQPKLDMDIADAAMNLIQATLQLAFTLQGMRTAIKDSSNA